MSQPPSPAARSSVFAHPLGFWFFFWGEFAERCSYYGMRAILWMYMTERLAFAEAERQLHHVVCSSPAATSCR